MTSAQQILSHNLKSIRKEKKLKQKDIERMTGILATTYSRIENMEVSPNLSSLEKIAEAFGVSLATLFQSQNVEDLSIQEKVNKLNELSEYNKNVVEIFIDTVLEKDQLEKNQEVKMEKRLLELKKLKN